MLADFPFCAVQGQDLFKKALLLNAVNPAIGGVLVAGPKGSAKSTLARSLAAIMPQTPANTRAPFVTLPLGSSIEMLTGTLNLEEILNNKQMKFSAGILSKADGGVLYVDEVNLLPDHLVDQLLDVAASGVNRIERDGISHSHASEFSLIGTMNPDEGELRGQLKDRFGLMVELAASMSLMQRVQIVKSREAFDQDPQGFLAKYDNEQRVLISQINNARSKLKDISCSDELRLDIAKRCDEAGVEGVRADIVMYRAALAHAALRDANEITLADIEAVAELVLVHRRTIASDHSSNDPKVDSKDDSKDEPDQESGPEDNNNSHAKSSANEGNASSDTNKLNHPFKRPKPKNADNVEQDQQQESDWGAMKDNTQQQTVLAEALSDQVMQNLEQCFIEQGNKNLSTKKQVVHAQGQAKQRSLLESGLQNSGETKHSAHNSAGQASIAWFSTIAKSARQWPQLDVQYHQGQKINSTLHLVLLDTSASTLLEHLSAKAKACVDAISKKAYLAREPLHVLGFGNDKIQPLLVNQRAPKELAPLLAKLEIAGGTPLRAVLQNAQKIIAKVIKNNTLNGISQLRCYLITDGRSRAQVADLKLNVPTVLIDTENSVVKRGRGRNIAEQLGASYFLLAY
jgi:magnesium chelatase subunit D